MRNKFVFFFKKAGIFLFLLMFVYIALIKIFGESVFPGKYVVVIFFSSLLSILFLLIPPKLNKENSYAWFFFISLMLIFWPIAIGFIAQEFHLFVLSGLIKIILGISLSLGFLGFFSSFFFGSGKRKSNEDVKRDVVDSFKTIVQKLGLKYEDKSTYSVLVLEASGNHKNNSISLMVSYQFRFRAQFFSSSNNKAAIMIKTKKEMPSYKIEVLKEAIRTEYLDELQKSKVISFIKEKQLDYVDFDLNTFEDKIVVSVHNDIEETKLWEDYIGLAEIILG